jgi:hypothetical protein
LAENFEEIERSEKSILFSSGEVYFYIFPELDKNWYIMDNILKDLSTKGLIIQSGTGYVLEINLETFDMIPQIQEIGKMFLSYISPPQLE